MGPRVALLILSSLLTLSAQNFGIVAVDPVSLTNIAVNSDASQVFFGARRMPDGTAENGINLYRADVAAGTVTKLTNYSPDSVFQGVTRIAYPGTGTQLAYSFGNIQTPAEEEIHILDTSTGADRVVYTYQSECTIPANLQTWNPCIYALHMAKDGTILFTSFVSKRLTTVKPDGTSKDLGVSNVLLSTSGSRVISDNGLVVFASPVPSLPPEATQATNVYMINLDGTGLKQITHFAAPEAAVGAVISADGSRIVFNHTYGFQDTRPGEVWTVRTDGSDLHLLASGTVGNSTVSPGGLIASSGVSVGFGTVSADGSTVTYWQNFNVKKVSTVGDPAPVDVTAYTTARIANQVLSDDGKKVALIIAPTTDHPAPATSAIHIVDAAPKTPVKFSEGTAIFAPRILYPLGIRSAAFLGSPSLGSLMTAFGYNLTQHDLTVATPTLPTKLDGLELLLNGSPLPMEAVTPWQINAQIPQNATPSDSGFAVRNGDATSPEVRASVAMRDPNAIFTDASRSQAAAVYPGTAMLADQDHPASAGQILELYMYGLGVTNPMVPGAVASPSSPPATATVVPRMRVAGVDAEIFFAGLTPGLAGVYQVNFQVPKVPPATSNPLTLFRRITWVAADGTETGGPGFFVK